MKEANWINATVATLPLFEITTDFIHFFVDVNTAAKKSFFFTSIQINFIENDKNV